jgi:hypothetical protein
MMRCELYILTMGLFAATLHAQSLLGDVAASDLGMPPSASPISFMALAVGDSMPDNFALRSRGNVTEITWEELSLQPGDTPKPSEVLTSIRKTFDEQGQPVAEVYSKGETQRITNFQYKGSRLLSRETTSISRGRTDATKAWANWKYNDSGKLIEFRRGKGEVLQDHYTNFKRDQQGHLLNLEWRQGRNDLLQQRTEFEYSPDGKTVRESDFDKNGVLFNSRIETLENGRVSKVEIHETDWRTRLPKRTITVAFKYDEQGRMIEQNTEPYQLDTNGGEFEIPIGKIYLTYDDAKRTRTTSYKIGETSVTVTFAFDESGSVLRSRREGPGQPVDLQAEYTYDDHGNWTTCKSWDSAQGSRKLTGSGRRIIVYRN